MNIEEIQKKAVDTYLNNMKFLKQHSPVLFKKLEVLELGLNEGLINSNYELELKNDEYFDILDIKNDSLYYGENSEKYSEKIIKDIDLDLTKNSFKTFQEFHYEEGVLERVKDAPIMSSCVFGNAPIVDYINNNSPKERISKQIYCYMIFGVGLGFHIPLLHKKIKAKLYSIVEPNLEIFRLSLFTTLYEELSKKAKIVFFVGLDKEVFTTTFREYHEKAYLYNHYIKFFYFSKNCEFYFEGIQSMLSSQSHNMFSYDRELKSLDRTAFYCRNEFNFIKINERFNSIFANDAPILILAGGPSLKRNLDFIKKNQKKFLIISLYSLTSFLKENEIYPDIITNYDEQHELYLEIFNKINDNNYFDNKVLLFGSHVSEKLVNLMPKENVYLFNALFSIKKDFGILTGPSIGEMTYALSLIFAPKNIYLLGLDLALDPLSGKSHFEGYEDKAQFDVNREATLENFSFRKNVLKVRGNLRDIVETTPIFNISIRQLDLYTNLYNPDKKVKVFNLSDGAYFKDIETLNIDNINLNEFEEIDKQLLHDEIKNSINKISSNELIIEDLEFNKLKLDDAKKLQGVIQKWLSLKHSTSDNFLKALEEIDIEFFNSIYSCKDLSKIVKNYFSHNLPYIFYFFSLKGLSNPKLHIKKISRSLSIQSNKIIDSYINLMKENINHFEEKNKK